MIKSVGPVTLVGPGWVEKAAFRSMQVTEQLGEPFYYELEVLSEDVALKPADVLGQPATVTLEVGEDKRYFNGFATSITRLGGLGQFIQYRIVLRPWLWFLSKTTNCRIFQQMTVPDIVKKVFREHGFTDFEELLSGTYAEREYVVQYRETDLHFVRRLLEHEGIYFYFKHDATTHTLVLADSISAHEPTPFYEKLEFVPPDVNRDAHLDHVETWESATDVETGGYALSDYDFEQPRVDLAVLERVPGEHAHAEYEAFDYPGNYKESGGGKRYAKTRIEELHASRSRSAGEGNARGVLVGSLFTLAKHPVDAANRDYLVVSFNAFIRSHELESGTADPGSVFRCRFTAIESDRTYRPPRVTLEPLVMGAQTATVVGKDGEEIWTDRYGRVKLRFHWDRFSPGNEESSCWVRVAQVWAGTNWGSMHVPRIGQEVIVEYLEGSPDKPIVTGRVYNFDNMPPYDLPKNQTQSGIKSRSTKDGTAQNFNEIRFEDKKGEEELFMQAEKNHNINVKKDQSTTVGENRSASVGANDSVSVGADRSLSVTGNHSVTVGTGGPAKSSVNVTGKHTLDTTDTIEIQAPTHIKLSCGGSSIMIEPGKITLSAGGGSSLVLDANGFMESSGGSTLLLDANACAQASGGAKVLLDGNVLAESSGMTKIVLDGNAAVESLGDIILKAMNISGTGNVQVTMTAGPSSAKLGPSGAEVAGPAVNINGMATVGVMAPMIKIG
jgi:type VI secretion system secreted protein VgrG